MGTGRGVTGYTQTIQYLWTLRYRRPNSGFKKRLCLGKDPGVRRRENDRAGKQLERFQIAEGFFCGHLEALHTITKYPGFGICRIFDFTKFIRASSGIGAGPERRFKV